MTNPMTLQQQRRKHWMRLSNDEKRRRRQEGKLLRNGAVQAEICRRVALGLSLTAICAEDSMMPHYDTVVRWKHNDPEFARALEQASRDRGEVLFDEAILIADDARNDWMARNDPNNPGWVANGEHIQRSKLRVETRKWAAAKLNPARYSDKAVIEGNDDHPVVVSVTHRFVDVVKHETLPPVLDVTAERKIDGWDDEDP